MVDNSNLNADIKKIIDDAFGKRQIIDQRKAIYKQKRSYNELLRTRILSILPIQRSKGKGLKCSDVADKLNERFFDYRNIYKKKLRVKISQMLRVLYKQGKARQKNGYWKRVMPKLGGRP